MITPGSANPLFLKTNGGYNLTRSLRFRSSATAYLSRTFGTPTSNTTWALSLWTKRGALGAVSGLFGGGVTSSGLIGFNISNQLAFWGNAGSQVATSTAVFRDPSAHGHLFVRSNGTDIKAFWNNVEVLSYTGTITTLNSAILHYIGRDYGGAGSYLDGYLSEVNFVDGQALTPSSFGAFSPYNQWLPKKYAGTYGTNGFYLPFTNNASAATLGNDFSGNSNTWTTNNISVTAGSTYDSMTDVPTLTSATAANFATLNPLSNSSTNTLSNANLTYSIAANQDGYPTSTIQFSADKYYWECTVTSTHNLVGITLGTTGITTQLALAGYGYYAVTGNKYVNGTASAYGSSFTTGDVIGVAVDMTALTITFYKNNTSQGAISIAAGLYKIAGGNGNSTAVASGSYNFGQRPFSYTPPTGYLALNTFNL